MFESNPGRLAGRFLRAHAMTSGQVQAFEGFVQGQTKWHEDRSQLVRAAMMRKSAVSAITASGSGLELTEIGQSWFEALRPLSIVSRFTGARSAPSFTRLVNFGYGATGYSNLGEGQPIPMTRSSATAFALKPVKTAAMTVVSRDLLKFSGGMIEEALTTDLAAAAGIAEDLAFLNPSTTGSILNGATAIASTGATLATIDADLKAAIAVLVAAKSTLAGATWIIGPTTATTLSMLRGSAGELAYPNITVRGGTLAGLPVLVSASVTGYIALVDQSGVVIGSDPSVVLDTSEDPVLEMTDAPTDNSVTPTATTMVSMFQTNSVVYRSVMFRSWALPRPGFGTYISGVTY